MAKIGDFEVEAMINNPTESTGWQRLSFALLHVWVLGVCIVVIGAFLVQFVQSLMFAISGENLTSRMRKDAFAAMLSQEMGW